MPETHRVQRLTAPSRDTHTNWNDKDPVIKEGVLGFTKDRLFNGSLEYFIGDGVHKYSELPKYGGATASTSSVANTLVLRDANGKIDADSISIPDATPTVKGIVKASTTKAADNAVKSDADGGLSGWKDAIIDAIIDDDGSGGLTTDNSGNLVVDFSQMPTDKFEALLKGLKMQIPLNSNINFYVDKNHANASDNTNDIVVSGVTHKRGEASYPFKTIQACVDYVTQTYAVGPYAISIYVVQATYTENVTLPLFTHTSGYIVLRAADYANPPTVTNDDSATTVINVTGGSWQIRRINITGAFSDPNDGISHYPGCVSANGGSTSVTIQGCAITAAYTGSASSNNYEIRMLGAYTGASISFGLLAGYHNSFNATKGNASRLSVIRAERGSQMSIPNGNTPDDGIMYEIPCSGSMTEFAISTGNSQITIVTGGANAQQFSGTMTGKYYTVTNGSSILAPSNGFPGDTAGTVDDGTDDRPQTYCWYRQ